MCAANGARIASASGCAGRKKATGREDKIAAIGIRVKRWVSLHGIALNVDPDLSHFSGIVPCGVREQRYGVTSLVDLGLPVTLTDVDVALKQEFEDLFGANASAGAAPSRYECLDRLQHGETIAAAQQRDSSALPSRSSIASIREPGGPLPAGLDHGAHIGFRASREHGFHRPVAPVAHPAFEAARASAYASVQCAIADALHAARG